MNDAPKAPDPALILQTWFGGTGNFQDPGNWSPPGPPETTNTLIINAGTAVARDITITNPLIRLGSPTTTPTLVLDDATLASTNTIAEQSTTFVPGEPPLNAEIQAVGKVYDDGTLVVGATTIPIIAFPAHMTVDLAQRTVFELGSGASWFSQFGSTLDVNAPDHGARFVNDGDIQALGGTVVMDVAVSGHGTFDVRVDETKFETGILEFKDRVGAGQTVRLSDGLLKLDDPKGFHAAITNFSFPSTIELAQTTVTSASFANNVLTLFNGQHVEDKLDIVGNFTTDDFVITNSGGNAFVSLSPTVPPMGLTSQPSSSSLASQVGPLTLPTDAHSADHPGVDPGPNRSDAAPQQHLMGSVLHT